jgi:hypothetical protein
MYNSIRAGYKTLLKIKDIRTCPKERTEDTGGFVAMDKLIEVVRVLE